ncbi:hypothetical protein [Flavobacterium sp. N502540]|uniref:hypothetical protein n=1 Tax=Flavobacterium sp. N502540 TaxID=2986838 RepID=UPI002224F018|nr:hypothetical protein [Flavobacterium sp. N502540]
MMKILELVHYGRISDSGFAEILVDIHIEESGEIIKNLNAFIDTGASNTSIKESLISNLIEIKDFEKTKMGSASNIFESVQVPIGVRLPMTSENSFISLKMRTVNMPNMKYDLIIGNDILNMCEFIYNGLSKTFFLKLYQTDTHINVKIIQS